MNKSELKNKLDALDINSCYYSLDGALRPMSTILGLSGSTWHVYDYDERGRVSDWMQFDTEDKACQLVLTRMIELKKFRETLKALKRKN